MNAIVIDDEPLARARLQRLLERIGIKCIATGENGEQAIELVRRLTPDYLFLDISMPGINGLEAAQKIGELDTPPAIIFCTAHGEYAVEAFQTIAAAYLLKPVFEDSLKAAISKASRLTKVHKDTALEAYKPIDFLVFKSSLGTERVPMDRFVYFQAIDKNVYAIQSDGRKRLMMQSLKELEEHHSHSLVCTFRGTLVTKSHMQRLIRSDAGNVMVELTNGDRLEVSRRQLREVKKCFE